VTYRDRVQVRSILRYAIAVAAPALVALALLPARDDLNHSIVAFALLAPVVLVAWVGGLGPGVLAAVVGAALFNFLFLPPYGTFTLERAEYVVVFVGFLAIAGMVSALVGRARDRAAAAEAREAEVRMLFDVSRELALAPERPEGLGPVVERAAHRMGFTSAELLPADGAEPAADALTVPLRAGEETIAMLQIRGPRLTLTPPEHRVLMTFADQLALALQADRLEATLREAEVYRRTDALRRTMLAAVSHELKSPLAAITTSVTDAIDQGPGVDPAYVAEVLADVRASTARLEQLITNLLDMSRIESGTLVPHRQAVDLAEQVDAAAAAVSGRWPEAAIRVEVPRDLPLVEADPMFLERVLVNLLENAARATQAEDDRRIEVSATLDGDAVAIEVRDHGPGLGPGDHESLFTPFYRLGERSPRFGTGLGLAISRGFLTAMGGAIEAAATTDGRGAAFVVRLPVHR
jgi:two-component system sensor histidine kinase KdpD